MSISGVYRVPLAVMANEKVTTSGNSLFARGRRNAITPLPKKLPLDSISEDDTLKGLPERKIEKYVRPLDDKRIPLVFKYDLDGDSFMLELDETDVIEICRSSPNQNKVCEKCKPVKHSCCKLCAYFRR